MRIKILVLFIACVFLYHAPVLAEPLDQEEWEIIESAYFTIYYRPTADLKIIERKLRRRRFYVGRNPRPGSLSSPEEKVAYRMDILLNRAKEILDMYPARMRLTVKIFKNQKELNDEYYQIFKKRRSLKSFYIHRFETIYTTDAAISDSVMAHEMGHAIIDHYFVVLPPEKVKEILACYVDLHLED